MQLTIDGIDVEVEDELIEELKQIRNLKTDEEVINAVKSIIRSPEPEYDDVDIKYDED